MEKYEIEKLRDLSIEEVAEQLGLQVVRHKALCPFHDDHHASLSFNPRKNTCRCFVCMDKSMDSIALVMRSLHVDFIVACRWLAERFGVTIEGIKGKKLYRAYSQKKTNDCAEKNSCSPNTATRATSSGISDAKSRSSPIGESTSSTAERDSSKTEPPHFFDASRFARFFEHPWLSEEAKRFLFEERKLDERVVRWCRLTSWQDREGTHWLQTPYFDMEGKLIGIQNRNLDYRKDSAKPRFRFPFGAKCSIYNLPVISMLRPGEELYITEGCSDCWAMLSAGHKAIAIPSATLLTPEDKQLLTDLSARLSISWHMYPDKDAPGERLFLQLKELLPSLVHHQLPLGCKDFGEAFLKQH